jgi:hypothetical protein
MILISGLIILFIANVLTHTAYEKNNPYAAKSGLPPTPGSGDVPRWISLLWLIGRITSIVGALYLVAKLLT